MPRRQFGSALVEDYLLNGDNDAWLLSTDTMIPNLLLQPYPAAKMKAHLVSTKVNSPRSDVPEVIEPVAA